MVGKRGNVQAGATQRRERVGGIALAVGQMSVVVKVGVRELGAGEQPGRHEHRNVEVSEHALVVPIHPCGPVIAS